MNIKKICIVISVLSGLAFNINAADKGFITALAAPDRPAEDKERDAARKPVQVIEFLGIESGMTVMDVMGGAGYYTEVLSAAVGPEGKVVAQNFEWMLQMWNGTRGQGLKAKVERLDNVEILLREFSPARPSAQIFAVVNRKTGPIDLGPITTLMDTYEGKMDVAITALNLHDMYIFGGEEGAKIFLDNIYNALKPGGVLGMIDHVGIAGQDNARLHRIEKSVALNFLKGAGFVIESESNILANPKDDHTLSMRDPSLGRNTDRMLIKARKPTEIQN